MNQDQSANDGASRYLPPEPWRPAAFEETYKSQVSILLEGLKLLTLANGGAVISILTLYGALVANCSATPALAGPIRLFAFGLVGSFLGYAASYFTQMNFMKWLTTEDGRFLRMHIFAFVIGFAAISASLALFIFGALEASTEFGRFTCMRLAARAP